MPSFWFEKIGSDLILHNKYGIFSKLELESQFKTGCLTAEELGQIYNLNKSRINSVLRSLGIVFRNSLEDTRIVDFEISNSMHQILLGTLLGDSYMKDPKYYGLGHSLNQMDYFYHVAEGLDSSVSKIYYAATSLGRSLCLWTNRHNLFVPYFDRFYSHGKSKKYIEEKTIYDLDPEGLAYWYMDDGKYAEYGAYFCVGNITAQEGDILLQLLKNKFNINATFQNHDIKKGYHNIYIVSESRSHFFDLIQSYIIPSMQYKLDGSPYPKIKNKEDIVQRHLSFCAKIRRPVRFSGDATIKQLIDSELNIQDPKNEYMESIRKLIKEGKQISISNIRKEPTEEILRKLFNAGLTDSDVANKLGFGRNRISKLRERFKIPIKVLRLK